MTASGPNDPIIDHIFAREGGGTYTNRPVDHGGPTRWGITCQILAAWRGHTVSADDVKALTEPEAREVTFELFIRRPGFNRIDDPAIREAVVDFAFLFGQDDAIPALQRLAGTAMDGVLGPKTAAAVNALEARAVVNHLACDRLRLHIATVVSDLKAKGKFVGTQAENLGGWANRSLGFVT